ncbi:sensor domain-containing diguanylate cyclase [uncultured Pseudomonas sp.]|uniref:GGDEF domain-containing protein n=1 Tax=uncultured Pseudomonas sp. TaxID=114707 RepID=UPI0025F37CA5|nr:sensor domain-containing diguanylate cyclase [uncultured Pseudomonas sp.]
MRLKAACMLLLIVFIAALCGIFARPSGLLSSFWPANAILAGLAFRNRDMAGATAWLSAFFGFVIADLVTGSTWFQAIVLTLGNVAGSWVAYALLSRLSAQHGQLLSGRSVLHLILVSVAASLCAGAIGALAMQHIFGKPFLDGFYFWFMGELLHYAIILPVMLTSPPPQRWLQLWREYLEATDLRRRARHATPFLALILSSGAGILIGGPGAVMFSVPALLWCAMTYNLFGSTLVTLMFSCWTIIAISLHYLDLSVPWPLAIPDLQSIRIGVLFLTLTPLTVAIITATRKQLLRQVQHLASHDQLSGLLNRRAFDDEAAKRLASLMRQKRLVAVLMLDIDHFKRINDTWGHSAGDQVLVTFAQVASGCLDQKGIIGRIGGEEFSVLMPVNSATEALRIAEEIRQRFAQAPVDGGQATTICATVSIGVVVARGAEHLKHLLIRADQALYQAKNCGRNCVQLVNLIDTDEPDGFCGIGQDLGMPLPLAPNEPRVVEAHVRSSC